MATIAVRLSRGNIIVPYRTLVHLGEEVRWTFEGDLPGDSRVEVYFDNPSVLPSPLSRPLPGRGGGGRAQAVAVQFVASVLGDHKYGVRIVDRSGRTVGDEDPYLLVVP